MRYSVLFFDDGPARAQLRLEDWRALGAAHEAFRQTLTDAGATVTDHQVLEPPATTTTLEFDAGRLTQRRAGPHVETRFVLGGFYVVEVENGDTLLDLLNAAPLPRGTGFVEVRPVV